MRKIIASLDIGDAWIKLVVGEMFKGKLNILSCIELPSRGIKSGFVVNPESATEVLEELFNMAEETIGIKPEKVVVSIPSNGAESFMAESYIQYFNQVIKDGDLIRLTLDGENRISILVRESDHYFSVYKKYSDSYELVNVTPTKYQLDDNMIVTNPVGMKAEKLGVKAVALIIPKKNIAAIAKCLEKIHISIVDIAIGPLGDYYEFQNKNYKSEVGAVINLGDSKTEVSIFNRGIMTSVEVIPMGGEKIDKDLSYVYKIKKADSVYLKENMCLADKSLALVTESMIFEERNGEKIKINQYDASEIVESRLEEILNLAKKQINLLTKKEISYIIVTGGVSETAEFKNILNEVFDDAIIGEVPEIGARNNKYATSLGLIKYYDSRMRLRNRDFSIFSVEEQEELSGIHKKVNFSENSILGKIFGYFFDN